MTTCMNPIWSDWGATASDDSDEWGDQKRAKGGWLGERQETAGHQFIFTRPPNWAKSICKNRDNNFQPESTIMPVKCWQKDQSCQNLYWKVYTNYIFQLSLTPDVGQREGKENQGIFIFSKLSQNLLHFRSTTQDQARERARRLLKERRASFILRSV